MLAFSLSETRPAGSLVDVLEKRALDFEHLARGAVTGALFGRKVMIASIDDLPTMKRIANRAKDLLDVAALEMLKCGEDPIG